MTDDFFGFIFDSGARDFLESKIFDFIAIETSNFNNPKNIRIYYGDISGNCKIVDLDPYINRNQFCTIIGKPRLNDWPYFVCLKGISVEQKDIIDDIFKNMQSYVGCTNLEKETRIETKRIWERLVSNIKIENDCVFFKGLDLDKNKFERNFKNARFKINYEYIFDEETKEQNNEDNQTFCLLQNYFDLSLRLNTEVIVAGGLIWDSVEKLSNISYFPKHLDADAEPNNVEDCYMCIYNASQGIERLQKSLIELILSRDNCSLDDEEKIYKLLMSHNHASMHEYLQTKTEIRPNKFGKLVNDLSDFYNKIRYNNYRSGSQYNRTYFYDILCSYSDAETNSDSISVKELESFKHNFASLLGDYALILYKNIESLSTELNVYTYELQSDFKASMVFWRKEDENLYKKYLQYLNAKKEVLYYLGLHGNEIFNDSLRKESLNFDPGNINIYCRKIIENSGFDYFEEFDNLYDELCKTDKQEFKNRLQFMKFLFSTDFDYFSDSMETEEDN